MTLRIRKPAADRKAEIQKTALDLAFEVGPNQVSTGMIAGKLGLTQPALYKHFPRKSDIWAAIAEHLSRRIAANITEAKSTGKTPIDRIRLLVMGHLELVESSPALPEIMVMRDPTDNHTLVQSAVHIGMTAFRAAIETDVDAAMSDGQFRQDMNPSDASNLIFGVIQSLALRMMITRNTDILMADGKRLLDLQLSGLQARNPR